MHQNMPFIRQESRAGDGMSSPAIKSDHVPRADEQALVVAARSCGG